MAPKEGERILRLRIVVSRPPPGFWLAVQEGKERLLAPIRVDADGIVFELPLRVATTSTGALNFLGAFAQGTPADRFVYVNSGTVPLRSGDPCTRRAKLKLGLVPRDLLDRALDRGDVLEARFEGTARDGGVVCASLPAATVQWRVTPSR